MRFLVCNPSPADPADQLFWGDFHFGRSLCRSLEELGHETTTRYWPNWDEPAEADVLLTLRGIREMAAVSGNFDTSVVWIISHPDDVSDEELGRFDIVLCGSRWHADRLRERGFDAHVFPQCTDSSIFYPRSRDQAALDHAFIFVGNRRGDEERTIVEQAVTAHLPLKIWGRGWNGPRYEKHVFARYCANELLGDLYRRSYCSLNDHWADMRSFQYINNRIFDALACGLPLLTEAHAGLDEIELGGIRQVREDEPFDEVIDEFIFNYDDYRAGAFTAAGLIREHHTFNHRARQLVSLL